MRFAIRPSMYNSMVLLPLFTIAVGLSLASHIPIAGSNEEPFRISSLTTPQLIRLTRPKFLTRPDLEPPNIRVEGSGSPGYTLFTPCKLVPQPTKPNYVCTITIVDNQGHIVYMEPVKDLLANFQKQRVGDNDVLSYWDGILKPSSGYGNGVHRILDQSYREIANFTAGPGLITDVHEFVIHEKSILITVFEILRRDLRYVGGIQDGYLLSGRIQRIDMFTNQVLFDWRAIEHFDLRDSLWPVTAFPNQGTEQTPWDFFHINSIDPHPSDGSILISSRHTSALYKLNGTTGEIIWILGGKKSNFTMGGGSIFSMQHDARWVNDHEISVFDNEQPPPGDTRERKPSRGIVLLLDYTHMTCTLKQQFLNPSEPKAEQAGSLRVLPNGNVFVSYGFVPLASEFASNGTLLFQMWWDAPASPRANPYALFSYRMLKTNWTAQPSTNPDVVIVDAILYMSWNGATEVAYWGILAGSSPHELNSFKRLPKEGFESAIRLDEIREVGGPVSFLQVSAIDRHNNTLGLSRVISSNHVDVQSLAESQVALGP